MHCRTFALLSLSFALVACTKTPSAVAPDSASTQAAQTASTETTFVHGLEGSLTIEKIDLYVDNEVDVQGGCLAPPGYTAIKEGLSVLLKDGNGSIISTTRLEPAVKVRALQELSPEDRARFDGEFTGGQGVLVFCQFPFKFSNVPASQVFQVEIPGVTNGSTFYTYEELEEAEWKIDLAIGG